jgi:hypothetical protein
MNNGLPLEQFSALDDWAPAAPVWRPYVPQAVNTPRTCELHEGVCEWEQ